MANIANKKPLPIAGNEGNEGKIPNASRTIPYKNTAQEPPIIVIIQVAGGFNGKDL